MHFYPPCPAKIITSARDQIGPLQGPGCTAVHGARMAPSLHLGWGDSACCSWGRVLRAACISMPHGSGMQVLWERFEPNKQSNKKKEFYLVIKKELTYKHWLSFACFFLLHETRSKNWSESVPLLKIKTSVLYRLDIEAIVFTTNRVKKPGTFQNSSFQMTWSNFNCYLHELLKARNISLKNSEPGIGG